MEKDGICVFGATSFVGRSVVAKLLGRYKKVICFSRKQEFSATSNVEWRVIPHFGTDKIADCIFIPPLWTLPEYFPALEAFEIKRLVVVSSTSLFTKKHSENQNDKNTSKKLKDAEDMVRKWATERQISCSILRPTLIYGGKNNKNIVVISKLIKRAGFFPIVGDASGLRQPVHYEDVSEACISALEQENGAITEYNLAGAERLTYKEMVIRVFEAMHRKPRFIRLPISLFKFGVYCLRLFPRFRYLTTGMIDRMNMDMIFDYGDASQKLGFNPRSFILNDEDVES